MTVNENKKNACNPDETGCGAYARMNRFFGSITGKIILAVLALLPMLLALGCAVYYIIGPGVGYFHSDCTDSLYWANASLEAGAVFDPTYRYAALLPFSAGIWMSPLIALLGFGMRAHNVGMIIFALVFALSIWFCCRASGWGRGWCSAAVAAVFLILSSSDKLREIMWGHAIYYSIGICILFVCIGLSQKLGDAISRRAAVPSVIWCALLLIMSAGAATDGVQVIALSTLPVAGALVAERIFNGRDRLISQKIMPSLAALMTVACGTVGGMLLLKVFKGDSVSAGYADAYSGYSDMSAWAGNAQSFFRQYLSLIGVENLKGETLFAAESIGNIVRIGMGLVLLAVPILMFCFYRRLTCRGTRLLLIAHSVLCAAIMFGFICGKLSGANWRLTPMVGSAVLLAVTGARELCVGGLALIKNRQTVFDAEPAAEDVGASAVPQTAGDNPAKTDDDDVAAGRVCLRAGVLLLALLMLASLLSAEEIRKMPADFGRTNEKHELVALLREHGLEYGYATFWYSQVITVLSESEATAREIMVSGSVGVYTDYYQSSRRWYDVDGYAQYFVLLTDSEYSTVVNTASWKAWTGEYLTAQYDDVEGFHVFVFSRNVLASVEQ